MADWLTKLFAALLPEQGGALASDARREPQLRPGQGSRAAGPERDALIRQALSLTAQKQHVFAELDAKTQLKFLGEAAQILDANARRKAPSLASVKKAR